MSKYYSGSSYDSVGVCVYDGGSGYDVVTLLVVVFMMVVVLMMMLVVVDFFSLFHTFTKVQFILSNAVI